MACLAAQIGPQQQPVFLIRTKHHSPPTYVGSDAQRLGRSSVFAFASRGLATRVAQGLEAHRRAAGHFPSVGAGPLELGPDAELAGPDLLEILELDGPGLASLVGGSGVAVCYMRYDTEDDEIHASVMHDSPVRRSWIYNLYSRPDQENLPP